MNQPLTLAPRSSLGSKFLMAVTGLGLTGFVIIHMLGNLQVFLGRDALNAYAKALKGNPAILWGARLGLLAIFLAHIVYGIRLYLRNREARPVPYAFKKYREASQASRTMLPTGVVILLFVVFHLAHYTLGWLTTAKVRDPATGQVTVTKFLDLHDAAGRHDVYAMTIYGFRDPVVSLAYVLAMGALAFHLSHGFGSLWQSLGLNNRRWAQLLAKASVGLAAVIFVGNVSMPLAVLFRLIGNDVP